MFDCMGDIIKVFGWDIVFYKKNLVVLWSHDGSRVLFIGCLVNVCCRYGLVRFIFDIEFVLKEVYEFVDTIY